MAGDMADLMIPCVAGIGEGIRGAKTVAKIADKADDVSDTVKAVCKSGSKAEIPSVSKRQTPDQSALHKLAKEAEKNAKKGNPISYEEAKILDEWAKEYNMPQHHYMDHIHIYNIHIPYEYR